MVFIISGHSMEPTLRSGDIVLVNTLRYRITDPKKGDIIAVKIKERIFIKRIMKREGENVFLRGDNVADSFDSRKFGMIEKSQIIGKVIFV